MEKGGQLRNWFSNWGKQEGSECKPRHWQGEREGWIQGTLQKSRNHDLKVDSIWRKRVSTPGAWEDGEWQ